MEKTQGNNLLAAIHWISNGVFLTAIGLVAVETSTGAPLFGEAGCLEALLLLSATVCTMTSLSRRLPLQNALLGAAIIALIGGVTQAAGALTSIPFGPFIYTDAAGPKIFDTLPWAIPLLWVVVILNSRGVARLILRPWRKLRVYGFWLIGLTTALSLLFDFGLEPFAAPFSTQARHFWLWRQTKLPFDWYGAPVTNFVGWIVTALLILAFASPSLVNKKPSRRSPPNFHPLAIWILLNALFVTGAIVHQFWVAAGFSIIASLVVIIFAVRGARW